MLFGTLGYIAIDDMPVLNAIYQTGITITTTGFGEMAPISPLGRIFTITLIIMGFVTLTFTAGSVVNVITNGEIRYIAKVRKMLHKIARIKDILFYII